MSDDVALRMRPGAGTHRCHWKIPTDLASTRENRSEIVMVAMTDEDPEGVQLPNGTQAPEGVERAEQTSEPEEAQAPEGVERAEGEDEPEEDDDEPRLFPGDIKLDPNRFPRGTLYGWLPDPEQ